MAGYGAPAAYNWWDINNRFNIPGLPPIPAVAPTPRQVTTPNYNDLDTRSQGYTGNTQAADTNANARDGGMAQQQTGPGGMPATLSNLASGFFGGYNGQVAPQLAGLAFGALPGAIPGLGTMMGHAMIQGPSPQFTFGRDGAAAQIAAALGLEKSGIDTTGGTAFGDMSVSGGSTPEGGKGDTTGGGAKGDGGGGWTGGDAPGWGGGYDPGLYAKGGKVRPNPESPDPPGEDDQMIAAQTGEGILTAKAMKRYPGLLQAANSGKLHPKKFKGLLGRTGD